MSKKFSLIIIAFLSLAILSCNPDYTTAQELEGRWNLKESKTSSTITTYPLAITGTTVVFAFSDVKEEGGTITSESTTAGITSKQDVNFSISEKGTKITLGSLTYDLQVSNKELIIGDNSTTITLEKL